MLLDSGQFSSDSSLPRNDHENSFDLRQSQQKQRQPDFFTIEPEFTGDFLFGNEPLFDESFDYTQQNVTVDKGEIQHNNQPQQDISNSGVNGRRSYFTNSPRGNDLFSPYTPQLDSLAHNQVQAHNEWGMMPETPAGHYCQQQSDTAHYGANEKSSMSMNFNSSSQNEVGVNQSQERNMYQAENQFTQNTVQHNVHQIEQGMTIDNGDSQHNNKPLQNISISGVNDMRRYPMSSSCENDHFSPYTPQLDSLAYNQNQAYNEWEMMPETHVEHYEQRQSDTINYGTNGYTSISMEFNSSSQNEVVMNQNQERNMYKTGNQNTQHTVIRNVHPEKQVMTVDTGEVQHNDQPQQNVSNSGVNDMRSYFTNSPRGNDHLSPYTPQLDSFAHNQVQAHNEWERMSEIPVEHHGQPQSETPNCGSNGNFSISMEFNSSDQNQMGINQNQEENMYQTENQITQHTVHHSAHQFQQNNQPQQDILNSRVNEMGRYPMSSSCENNHLSPYTPPLDSLAYNQNQARNEWGTTSEIPVEHYRQRQSNTLDAGSNANSSMSMEFTSSDQNQMGMNQNQEENMYQTENQFTQQTIHHIVQVTPSNEVITVRGIQEPYPSSAEPVDLQKSTNFSHVFIKCGNTVESQNEVKQIDANDTPNENCRDKKKTFTPYTPAQLEILCEQFEIKNYLTSDVRDDLAQRTGLTKYQVIGWFTNKRKRIRDKPKEEAKRKKLDAARRQEAEVWVKEAIAMYDEKIISEELAGNNFD
uniref:Homeobox domain-containing protein n=1 Tax=Caenorhabditis tropicalis TaxID=1561998 RepID=A0A1I7V3S8_9PELO